MAPTEILAEQHFKAFSVWFKPMGFEVDWFAGSQSRDKKPALERLASVFVRSRWARTLCFKKP